MINVRGSITGFSIAFLVAACGSDSPSTPSQGGAGGNESGGAGGQQSGGSGGNQSGGSGGNQSGGAGGSQSGGAGGEQSGGASGEPRGGSSGSGSGGAGGTTTGAGGGTSATGGAAGGGGRQTGGTQSQGGSSGTNPPAGGATAAGGAQAGGTTAAGGTTGTGGAGTGGTTVSEPQLVTSGPGAYWKTGTWTEVASGSADVTVNDGTTYQTWAGFGGTFNEMGWDALAALAATDRDRAVKLLFHPSEGANFAFGRVPIGASDYAMDRYSLNENAGDYTMDNFSIERDREKLIPFIKAALAVRPDVHLWASPWTPPTWMKTGSYTADGKSGWDGGNMKDDAQVLKAHAIYLAKFVEEYAKEQITIEAIHPQNEPGYATRYPSCLWSPALMNKFIGTYLGPTFEERKVTAQIYLGTMSNNESGKDGTMVSTVLGDSTAMKYVKGCGLQWNMIDSTTTCANKGLQVVQSEHKCGNYPFTQDCGDKGDPCPSFNSSSAPNDHAYGVESWKYIRNWVNKGVHVYSAWNMVLDTNGKNLDTTRPWPQNALLVVNRSAKTLTLTPAYYVFRHASQLVDPGAKRVGTSGGDALAFKNPDGSIVAVMYSKSGKSNHTVKVGGKLLQFNMPADGWATVNWK